MHDRVLLSSPHMSDEGFEMEYIKEAFDTNWIAPLGSNVDSFESEMADYIGSVGTVALSSGTAAIHLALKSANVQEGDIVFCQSLTFAATANPIIYEKATPVFIDSDYKTWNMCPKALEKAFEKYPNVKAVIVVHLYGLSADMDPIVKLCKKYNAILIEDAAESLGTMYKNRYTGTIGDYGIFSFNGNKIITTSGGGMLVSKEEERIKKARFWATQSKEVERYYHHVELGYNYRMSNVVAGIGRGQLRVLGERVNRKREIYAKYKEAFKDISGIQMMPVNDWDNPNCWLSVMLLDETLKPLSIIEALEHNNIESRHVWKPMHIQPLYENFDYIGEGCATDIFERGVCLPSDTKMTDIQQIKVIDIIRGVCCGKD